MNAPDSRPVNSVGALAEAAAIAGAASAKHAELRARFHARIAKRSNAIVQGRLQGVTDGLPSTIEETLDTVILLSTIPVATDHARTGTAFKKAVVALISDVVMNGYALAVMEGLVAEYDEQLGNLADHLGRKRGLE